MLIWSVDDDGFFVNKKENESGVGDARVYILNYQCMHVCVRFLRFMKIQLKFESK